VVDKAIAGKLYKHIDGLHGWRLEVLLCIVAKLEDGRLDGMAMLGRNCTMMGQLEGTEGGKACVITHQYTAPYSAIVFSPLISGIEFV